MSNTVSVFDVAAYILNAASRMTTWKLQKLCYYAQAWSLVWEEEALFRERVEAWVGGPVVPALYQWHRGRYQVETSPPIGNPNVFTDEQRETIDIVLDRYGKMRGVELVALTHSEAPWRDARMRAGLHPTERGNAQIRRDSMAEYYSGLFNFGQDDEEA